MSQQQDEVKVGAVVIRPDRRYVMLQRHLQQWKPAGASLTDWGPSWPLKWETVLPQAERIQYAYTRGVPIAYAGVSRLTRTLQTLALVAPQARAIERLSGLTPPDYTNVAGTWDALVNLKTEMAAEFEATDPKLFALCGKTTFATIRRTAHDRLPSGGVAFLVSHNPLCEAALATFLGGSVSSLPVPNFAKGDIVLFEFENGVYGSIIDWHYLPVPPEPDYAAIEAKTPHL